MWIKVESKLPEEGSVVLAFNDCTGVNQAVFEQGTGTNGFTLLCWGNNMSNKGWFPYISYWMPLPAPPKSDTAEPLYAIERIGDCK